MRRAWIAILAVALLWLPAAAGAGDAEDVLRHLNAFRSDRGLGRVEIDPRLNEVAQRHVADLVDRAAFDLDAPALTAWLKRAGYEAAFLGPLLVSQVHSPEALVRRLRDSRELRDTVYGGDGFDIGVARRVEPFRVGRGQQAADVWSVILAREVPVLTAIPDAIGGVLDEINRARARRGAPPVRLDSELSKAASVHADDMIRRGYFGHRSPEGDGPGDRVSRTLYDYEAVGENLAAGQSSATEVVDAWHDSPGHARTMYDPAYEDIGLAYRLGPLEYGGNVSPHVWVSVYGTARQISDPVPDAVAGIVDAINRARRANGLPPLRLDPELGRVADALVADMVTHGVYASRVPANGPSLRERILASDYASSLVGLRSTTGASSVEDAAAQITGARGRGSVFDRRFSDVGVAYRLGPVRTPKVDYFHTWIVLLGKPK